MKDSQISNIEQFNEYLKRKENMTYNKGNYTNNVSNNNIKKLQNFSKEFENYDGKLKENQNYYINENMNIDDNLYSENLDVDAYDDNYNDIKKYKSEFNNENNNEEEYGNDENLINDEKNNEYSENFEENSIEYIQNYAQKNKIEMEDLEIYKDKFNQIKSSSKNMNIIKTNKKLGKEQVVLNKKIKLFEDKNIKKRIYTGNKVTNNNIKRITNTSTANKIKSTGNITEGNFFII